jgi:hypothetical protein
MRVPPARFELADVSAFAALAGVRGLDAYRLKKHRELRPLLLSELRRFRDYPLNSSDDPLLLPPFAFLLSLLFGHVFFGHGNNRASGGPGVCQRDYFKCV